MSTSFALAIKRLHGGGIVRAAARHNLREIAAELGAGSHIDTKRIADNVILRGPATGDEVAELAGALLQAAGIGKLRKNCVQALELLFTLPASTAVDLVQYFEEATAWAAHYFAVPVLSSVIHRDEGAPHAHVLLLPLLDGHMVGSDLHGGRAQLWAMQKDFYEAVGVRHGLARQAPQKRLSAPVRGAAMDLARTTLMANSALTDSVIEALLAPHAKDPAPLLLALGITMPTPLASGQGSFADIMTKPVALEPRNPIGNANRGLAAAVADQVPERSQPYPCVGIVSATDQILSHPAGMPTASAAPAAAKVQHPSIDRSAVLVASPARDAPVSDTSNPAPVTGHQLARSPTEQPADEVQNQHPTARRLLSFKDTPSVTTARATMDHLLSFEDISTVNAPCEVGAPLLDAGQRQASTGMQNILHTPLVASTNPVADQEQPAERLGKNTETFSLPTAGTVTSTGAPPRKRATKPPVATAGRPQAKRAAGTALSVDHGEQHDQVPAQQQASQHPSAPVHARVRTPDSFLRGDAGQAVAAAVPARVATKGQNGPVPLPIVPSAPASSRTGKSRRTAAKVVSTARTITTAHRQPAGANGPGNLGPCLPAPIAHGPATASQAAMVPKRKVKRDAAKLPTLASTDVPENSGARPPAPITSSTDQVGRAVTTRKRNAKTAGAKVVTTTSAKPAGPTRSPGGGQSLHPIVPEACSTTAKPASSKRATKGAQSLRPLSPDASTTAAKRRPASSSSATPADEVDTCAPLKVSSSVGGTDATAPGLSSADKATTGTAAPARRERLTAVKPGKSRNKSHAPGDEELSTTSSHDLGESPNAQDVDQPDEIRTLGAGVGPLSPASEYRTKPASMPSQAPPIGGAWDGAGMLAPHADLEQHDDADDYQRHRDDDQAAEHWDEQRGEFVTAPTTPARRHTTPRWPGADRLCGGWQEARPSVVEAVLTPIRSATGPKRTERSVPS